MNDLTDEERDTLRGELANVLSNASNYPERLQTRILGQDMGPLIAKVADAAVAALYPVIAHKAAQTIADQIAGAFPLNGELDYDGTPKALESAYVEGLHDAHGIAVSAFPAPTTPEGQKDE